MALEAMASGLPVVASKIGGLRETVIDLREDKSNGTGILVPIEDPIELAKGVVSLVSILRVGELLRRGFPINCSEFEAKVYYEELKDLICRQDVDIRIRRNAINRVEKAFRWRNIADMVKKVYVDSYRAREGYFKFLH